MSQRPTRPWFLPIRGRRGARSSSVVSDEDALAGSLRRFMIGSLLTLIVLVLAVYVVGHWVARQQALHEAEDRAHRLSETLGGLVTRGVRRGDEPALVSIDRALADNFTEGHLVRAKVWDADGKILWSDQEEIIGQQFRLPAEVTALLGTSTVHSELSDLEDPENASERGAEEMLEVYAGAYDVSGRPVLVEVYVSTEHMRSYERAIIAALLPLGIVCLLLFQAATLPLAMSLGRRVRRADEMRARSASQALQASELERKRIAQELHDGIVQDLAGVGFSLPGVRRSLLERRDVEGTAATVRQIEGIVRRDLSALRSMMIDVYPPDLETKGVVEAVADLVTAERVRGRQVDLDVVGDLDLPPDCARLLYRVAREGLHNVVKHAKAERAVVTLERRPDAVVACVCDDGIGARASPETSGDSLGLRLLTESIEDAGGTLTLRDGLGAAPRPGTCLEAFLPWTSPRRTSVQEFSKGLVSALARVPRQRGAGSARNRVGARDNQQE